MDLIYNKIFLEHETGDHPESAKRLLAFGPLSQTKIPNGQDYLSLVHSQEYIEKVKLWSQKSQIVGETVFCAKSYKVACYAVGASILASERNGFALVRPPGHHVPRQGPSQGFCVFNNIAIASQKLVQEGKKVLILDIDGHFGNGTSQIFYNTNRVLYVSWHQFPAYPGSGWIDEIGQGKGQGYNVNIPLPPGSGDDLFFKSLEWVFPIIKEFGPDVVAISAGFDAYRLDPLLNLGLSLNAFHRIGRELGQRFKKIFAVLEGGYNTSFLPRCVFNLVSGINQERIEHSEQGTVSDRAVQEEFSARIKLLEKELMGFWRLNGPRPTLK